jgi:hypothetical protein
VKVDKLQQSVAQVEKQIEEAKTTLSGIVFSLALALSLSLSLSLDMDIVGNLTN